MFLGGESGVWEWGVGRGVDGITSVGRAVDGRAVVGDSRVGVSRVGVSRVADVG